MTCSHSLRARTALTLSMAMLAMVAAPAPATPVIPLPAPTPAPSGVAGPPDGLIAPPPANTRPLPTPQIIVPAPTPSPTPPLPTPRVTQPSRSIPAPAPRPASGAPAPTQAVPAPAPAIPATEPSLGEIQPSPLPGMSEEAATAPQGGAAPPATAPATADSTIPEWLPLAAIAAATALLGGALFWRRRRKHPLAVSPPDVHATPPAKPTPPRSAPPVAAPAPTPIGRRADLSVGFEALSAQSTLINLRIRYAVVVRNMGTLDAEPVTVRIGLFAGSQANPQGIAQWFMLEGEGLHHGVDRVAAGSEYRFEGELAAPLEALNPITVDGRVLAIPLVAVDARYNHGPGQAPIDGQAARAFVIGREPGREGAKLAPFRLDQGPTSFAPLGQRDTGISKVA